jgi:tetratricopeptide (TPR) repeat protein
VGREKELTKLHQWLTAGQRVSVWGMGGLGKSELVLQYWARHSQDYPGGLIWLEAPKEAGQDIVVFGSNCLNLEFPQELPIAQKVDRVWAQWPREDRVLVVADNLNTVDDYRLVEKFLPSADRFCVLATSRVRLTGLKELPLEELSLPEAVELLERRSQAPARRHWDRAEAATLCQRLGRLPLAIALVGSYLAVDPNLSLGEISAELTVRGLEAQYFQNPDLTVAKRGLNAVFALSWQALDPPTQRLAALLAMFAAAPIEWRLVEKSLISSDNPTLDQFSLRDLRQILLRYALLQSVELPEEGLSGYQFHPLIWDYLRRQIPHCLDQPTRQAFVTALVAEAETIAYNGPLEDYKKVPPSIPHIAEVAETWTDDLADEDLITLYTRLSRFYEGFLDYQLSEVYLNKGLSLSRQHLPQNHPDITAALNNLGLLYKSQGRYSEAEPLYTEALAIGRKSLPPNHPQLATHLNNLAVLYRAQGRYSEAEPLYTEALAIDRKSLPPDHPDLAVDFSNLAGLYESQGRYSEAEPLYTEALAIGRKSLPPNHPQLATHLNNLAALYESQGRYSEAEPLYTEALAIDRKSLRPNHPQLATHLNNLAALYREQGRYSEAEPLYKEALAIDRKSLPPNHPSLASALNNLAGLYEAQKKSSEAEPLYTEALAIDRKSLPPNHPSLAIDLNNLAALYESQGRDSEAESLYTEALAISEVSLGAGHSDTRTVRANYEHFLQQLKNE